MLERWITVTVLGEAIGFGGAMALGRGAMQLVRGEGCAAGVARTQRDGRCMRHRSVAVARRLDGWPARRPLARVCGQ